MRYLKKLRSRFHALCNSFRTDLSRMGSDRIRIENPVPGQALTVDFATGERIPYNQLEMSARNARRLARRKDRT